MSWQRAKGRLSLDPGWQTCPSCDCDFDRSVRFTNGLCPECAREKELAEAAEEEMADVKSQRRRAQDARYRESHREILRQRCRAYRASHLEERNAKAREYHKAHPLRNLFYVMRQRCGITKGASENQLAWYAKRGITVSPEWATYEKFEQWALSHGWRKGLQIDRIDNNGNYGPDNCRFVTPKENSRNRRTTRWVVFMGAKMSLAELSEKTGVKRQTITNRIKRGMTPEAAVAKKEAT